MTFKSLRRLSLAAIVLNVAFVLVALLWLTIRLRTYLSEPPLWPWWQDFDIVASSSWAAASAYTFAVLWTYLRKTSRGPLLEALQDRQRQQVRDLELEVQRAELQKRLRDLTKPT
jgi:hypothetical protein